MEILQVRDLSFRYPDSDRMALHQLNFQIKAGEFVIICGESGCGKSTLLKLLKKEVAPAGIRQGEILFQGMKLEEISYRESAKKIGYVAQNSEGALVTEKVYSELAFGLENFRYDNSRIRMKVSETAISFGIEDLFHKKVDELSGGQKQIVNLAAVLVMEPLVLLLDEPTSKLDRIAAEEFINIIRKLSETYGITIIMAEHNLEDIFSMADRVLVLEEGRLIADKGPEQLYDTIKNINPVHNMIKALPCAVRLFGDRNRNDICPLNVKEAVRYLEQNYDRKTMKEAEKVLENAGKSADQDKSSANKKLSRKSVQYPVRLRFDNIWFRYKKEGKDVLRGAGLAVIQNTLHCLLGGNGSGKSTLLSVIAGLYKPYRGHMDKTDVAYMCQTPQLMFLKETIYEDFLETGYQNGRSKQETETLLKRYEEPLGLGRLWNMHPYDLSGGEIQKAALVKILLSEADFILLDEPTKGMDACSKEELGRVLKMLLSMGKTILMVTHDVEFAAEYGDYCSMIFNGEIFGTAKPAEFFEHNTYFTTYTSRIMRRAADKVITVSQAEQLLNCYEEMAFHSKMLRNGGKNEK